MCKMHKKGKFSKSSWSVHAFIHSLDLKSQVKEKLKKIINYLLLFVLVPLYNSIPCKESQLLESIN